MYMIEQQEAPEARHKREQHECVVIELRNRPGGANFGASARRFAWI